MQELRPTAAHPAHPNELANRRDNALGVEHDVLVQHPKRNVAELGAQPISSAIAHVGLPGLVIAAAVRLDYNASFDDHVDTANPWNLHLKVVAQAGITDNLPKNALLPCVNTRIDQGPHAPVSRRDMRENLWYIRARKYSFVKRGVQRGQSEVPRLAADDLGNGIPRTDTVFGSICRVDQRPPMQFDPIAGRICEAIMSIARTPQARSASWQVEMGEVGVERENAEFMSG